MGQNVSSKRVSLGNDISFYSVYRFVEGDFVPVEFYSVYDTGGHNLSECSTECTQVRCLVHFEVLSYYGNKGEL